MQDAKARNTRPRRARARWAWLGLLAALGFGCGSGSDLESLIRSSPATGVRILVIGVDGATFDVIHPMVEEGRLPAFQALMERGSHAPLLSLEHTWSPAVWTTVATGHLPEVHGVRWFQSEGSGEEPKLIASTDRDTLAVWNIASRFRRSVGIIGWWVTWPAEPVNGFLISDRFAHTRYQSWTEGKRTTHLTWPAELAEDLAPLIVDPLTPPMDELDALAEFTPEEREEMLAAKRPILYHGLSVLKWGYTSQRTYEQVTLEMLARGQPDLSLTFLIAVDPISHTFWHYYQPDRFIGLGPPVDPEKARRIGPIIPNIYAHDDRAISRLLSVVDPDTVVILLSDHGFGPARELPRPSRTVTRTFGREERIENPVLLGQSGIHRLYGVLIAAGGPVLTGARFRTPPTVADITPTILALLGLPVAEDMEGRVLTEILEPAFLEEFPVRKVPSYEGMIERVKGDAGSDSEGLDSERAEYLRALGYIE